LNSIYTLKLFPQPNLTLNPSLKLVFPATWKPIQSHPRLPQKSIRQSWFKHPI